MRENKDKSKNQNVDLPMTKDQIDEGLREGIEAIKAGRIYSTEEVDEILMKELGI